MKTVKSKEDLRAAIKAARREGKKISFVPTMGYLHEGHLSLVRLARTHSDFVVVSIFVNPTQFNDPKDYEKYPIDIERDSRLLEGVRTDLLFIPDRETIYGGSLGGAPFQSWVTLDELPRQHEGEFRPGHFRGVSTVVAILFNLVAPDVAVFGEKDFQQLRIIEQMVEDLRFDISIVRGPLVREADGLAMSSRNVRLSPEARTAALLLSGGLKDAVGRFRDGERRSATLCEVVRQSMAKSSLITPEYVRLVEEKTLNVVAEASKSSRLLVAAQVGGVRLIDTMGLGG